MWLSPCLNTLTTILIRSLSTSLLGEGTWTLARGDSVFTGSVTYSIPHEKPLHLAPCARAPSRLHLVGDKSFCREYPRPSRTEIGFAYNCFSHALWLLTDMGGVNQKSQHFSKRGIVSIWPGLPSTCTARTLLQSFYLIANLVIRWKRQKAPLKGMSYPDTGQIGSNRCNFSSKHALCLGKEVQCQDESKALFFPPCTHL